MKLRSVFYVRAVLMVVLTTILDISGGNSDHPLAPPESTV